MYLLFLLCGISIVLSIIWANKEKKKKRELIPKILNEYDLTFSDMMFYNCRYVGGHPERNKESSSNGTVILFGVKNSKLIFFESSKISFGLSLIYDEGKSLKSEKVIINSDSALTYLFDIPINSIIDIRYFDETTSTTVAGVGTSIGGIGVGIPIKMQKGDAAVIIDWRDGRFTHSTEFRVSGNWNIISANERANSLRNTLIRMTR